MGETIQAVEAPLNLYGGVSAILDMAEVDGNQVVRVGYRLRMRLTKAATINDVVLPKNTLLYGFISFQPNRAKIEIENINHQPTRLKAFDLQDGSEGIYIENSFIADATTEVIGDIVEDINIAGVPQVTGIKKIFQRNNRNVKVTVANNYQLILKSELWAKETKIQSLNSTIYFMFLFLFFGSHLIFKMFVSHKEEHVYFLFSVRKWVRFNSVNNVFVSFKMDE